MTTSNFNRPKLFQSSTTKRIVDNNQFVYKQTSSDARESNINSTASFKFDSPGSPLKSTQQIPIDWSQFQNHTFFNSAVVKTNVAFDKIINGYPFDGTRYEMDEFLDNLTGFEKYVYDNIDKNVGYLNFSGTAAGETTGGTYIIVNDFAGSSFPAFSKTKTGENILDPKDNSFTIEMHLFVPSSEVDATNYMTLAQKISGTSQGFGFFVLPTNSSTKADLIFSVVSGSNSLYVSASGALLKGQFNHVAAVFDRTPNNNKALIYANTSLVASSSTVNDIGSMQVYYSALTIGSGSRQNFNSISSGNSSFSASFINPGRTLTGSIDDFRVWHGARTSEQIKQNYKKSVYATNDLKLYFKFNEPTGSLFQNSSLDATVLDSSGNSLHSTITNYFAALRTTSSLSSPVTVENVSLCPVLFPFYTNNKNFNADLIYSGTLYDQSNPNLITKLVPKHYLLEGQIQDSLSTENGTIELAYTGSSVPGSGKLGSSQIVSTLLYTWAKFFDEIKLYVDLMGNVLAVDYDSSGTTADQFLPFLAQHYGFDLPGLFGTSNISQYVDGDDTGFDLRKSTYSLQYVQNQIWRRILTNINDIIKSKGTLHSIKSFIRSVGINPDSNMRIREYGGSTEKNFDISRNDRTEVSSMINFSGSLRLFPVTTVDVVGDGATPGIGVYYTTSSVTGTLVLTSIATGSIGSSDGFTLARGNTILLFQETGYSQLANGPYVIDDPGTVSSSWVLARMQQFDTSAEVVNGIVINVANGTVYKGTEFTLTTPDPIVLNTTNLTFQRSEPARGASSRRPFLLSKYLSGSRVEGGQPLVNPSNFVNQGIAFKNGVSNVVSNGLFTSGSWTYEGIYRFPLLTTGAYSATQSLMRMQTSGTLSTSKNSTHNLIVNCLFLSGTQFEVKLFMQPSFTGSAISSTGSFPLFVLPVTGANLYDGNKWNVSFGRQAAYELTGANTSNYFLRVARQNFGEIVQEYVTSSLFSSFITAYNPNIGVPVSAETGNLDKTTVFSSASSELNAYGCMLVVGSQSFWPSTQFLNTSSFNPVVRSSLFEGMVGHMRFWSKSTSIESWRERVRNFKSLGVREPKLNFNFSSTSSGSWERLRMDVSTDQPLTNSDAAGNLYLTDFSQNSQYISASGFEISKKIIYPETFNYSHISSRFDEASSNNKIRIRSFQDQTNVDLFGSEVAPFYELRASETPTDDTRFSIDFSIIESLDEDIINIFSSLDAIETAIGGPEMMYSDDYPDLAYLRKIYFNRLTDRVNLKGFFEFFKWFDSSMGYFIDQLIPRKTNFLGINYVIESHMLERHKIRYQQEKQYLGDANRPSQISNIYLQLIDGLLRKY